MTELEQREVGEALARRCTPTDLSRPGRIAGRRIGSSARSAFVASTVPSAGSPKRSRSAAAISGTVIASAQPDADEHVGDHGAGRAGAA